MNFPTKILNSLAVPQLLNPASLPHHLQGLQHPQVCFRGFLAEDRKLLCTSACLHILLSQLTIAC